jgi:hypothetical protein
MPFGLDSGSWIFFLLAALVIWALPLAAGVWALVTLARLRAGQRELLARLTSLERRLGERT